MNKTKSIVTVIMVMIVTLIAFTACHNKKCKDGEKCEKASCCKDSACCDKCSDKCTVDNKCCDKCKVGEEKACCKEEKCCDKCEGKCTAENKCCDKCKAGEGKSCCKKEDACCKKDGAASNKVIDSVSVKEKAAGNYACPMHKDITSDKAGKCSKCGMEMEKTK